MDPRKIRFYAERIEKEEKYASIQEEYTVTTRAKPLAGKFYAKHDVAALAELADLKREYCKHDTKDDLPITVNAKYGLFQHCRRFAGRDHRLHFPRKQTDFVAYELGIRQQHKAFPPQKFVGIPFKV